MTAAASRTRHITINGVSYNGGMAWCGAFVSSHEREYFSSVNDAVRGAIRGLTACPECAATIARAVCASARGEAIMQDGGVKYAVIYPRGDPEDRQRDHDDFYDR